jgi:hypothetical protein
MNRKGQKKRKMQLKRMGMEAFIPPWDSLITANLDMLPSRSYKHIIDGQIQCGKLRGYEFLRRRKSY